MEKSFITKLNSSTNRTDLPILGKIRINITGKSNSAQSSGITGSISIIGSPLTWTGSGKCAINTSNNVDFFISIDKDTKGLLYIDDKYNVTSIDTMWAYGANVLFEDINKYCKNITSLFLGNSEQEGDLSDLKDLGKLISIGVNGSKITGDVAKIRNILNLVKLNISGTSIACDLSYFTNCANLSYLNVSNTSTTGDLSTLVALDKLEDLSATGTGVTGDLSSFANKASLKQFNYWELSNTWNNDSLRPSNMSKITGAFGFATSADTDNFLKNMAKCSDEGVERKTWYFQNSHRTSASDAAVSTLQNAGYTLSQLITD